MDLAVVSQIEPEHGRRQVGGGGGGWTGGIVAALAVDGGL